MPKKNRIPGRRKAWKRENRVQGFVEALLSVIVRPCPDVSRDYRFLAS